MQQIVADRYELEDVISDAEHTTVYRAVDLHLRRRVTVRLLDEYQAGDPVRAQQFLDEARVAASYGHPNVVATYDAGVAHGIPFSVSEHVDGERLDALIRNAAPLRADRLRTMGIQLASALHYIQQHDGTEYSLLPQDVMVTSGDRIKVLAFRRVVGRQVRTQGAGFPESEGTENDPASANALPTGVRCVGFLLYQMATGRHPLQPEQNSPIDRDLPRLVRPSSLNPYLSTSLERTILGALKEGADRRYRSLPELVLALQAQEEAARGRQSLDQPTVVMTAAEPTPLRAGYREGSGWTAVVVPTIVLALVLVAAIYAAVVFRPQFQVPTVAGFITGTDQSPSRDSLTARSQAADLEKAISAVQSNAQKLNSSMALVRARLTAERSIADAIRGQVEDMKREASTGGPNPGKLALLAAKHQSFSLSYATFESARRSFADAAADMESRLAPMDADASRVRDVAERLRGTLAASATAEEVQPRPGDERGPLSEYAAAADSARNDLAAARKTETELADLVNSFRQQADDAAAMRVAQQPPAAPAPTEGVAGRQAPAPVSGSQPGSTPSVAVAPSPTPAAIAAPRPTAPPPPRSAPTYPVAGTFAPLARQIGNVVGAALEKEHVESSGDMFQRTTGGMLVWSKATGRAYFTDGFVTWVVGPNGLQSRPNDENFEWEKVSPGGQH